MGQVKIQKAKAYKGANFKQHSTQPADSMRDMDSCMICKNGGSRHLAPLFQHSLETMEFQSGSPRSAHVRLPTVKPKLAPGTYNVSAYCPDCGVVTAFSQSAAAFVNGNHSYNGQIYSRVLYAFTSCSRCGRGGLATIPDNGNPAGAVLESFCPIYADAAPLPEKVPPDIQAEFREAENCAASGFNRAASALFRSVLEKTLKANGYVKGSDPTLRDLQKRIDAAAEDGIITETRKKRAHDEIRSLGNDVLHDDWRVVEDTEVEEAHGYMQRILEDFYDDRPTVEAILREKGKLAPEAAS